MGQGLHAGADKCVLDSCRYLQHRGFDVTYLPVKKDGLIDMQQLEDAIRPDTGLVSVMMVNNEIGDPLCPSLASCAEMLCPCSGVAAL